MPNVFEQVQKFMRDFYLLLEFSQSYAVIREQKNEKNPPFLQKYFDKVTFEYRTKIFHLFHSSATAKTTTKKYVALQFIEFALRIFICTHKKIIFKKNVQKIHKVIKEKYILFMLRVFVNVSSVHRSYNLKNLLFDLS